VTRSIAYIRRAPVAIPCVLALSVIAITNGLACAGTTTNHITLPTDSKLTYITVNNAGVPSIWLADTDNSLRSYIGRGVAPYLSQDGQWLIYARCKQVSGCSSAPLYRYDVATKKEKRLATNAYVNFWRYTPRSYSASPSSRLLAMITRNRKSAKGKLAIYNMINGNIRTLTEAIFDSSVSFGEDGRYIYVVVSVDATRGIEDELRSYDLKAKKWTVVSRGQIESGPVAYENKVIFAVYGPGMRVITKLAIRNGKRYRVKHVMTRGHISPSWGEVPLCWLNSQEIAEGAVTNDGDIKSLYAVNIGSGKTRIIYRAGTEIIDSVECSRDGSLVLINENTGTIDSPPRYKLLTIPTEATSGEKRVIIGALDGSWNR
jgi:hypothetical protein